MEIGCQSIKNKFFAKGIAHNFLIAFIALILTWIFGGPKIDIEFKTALILSLILFIIFLTIILWTLIASPILKRRAFDNISGGLSDNHKNRESQIFLRYSVKIFEEGPCEYIRHPACAAIIFFLNPAIAIIFRSWLYLLACVAIYFSWKSLVENEETAAARTLGKNYQQYRLNTNLFFPDLRAISRPFYFILIGIVIFLAVFIALNFSSLSLRYVSWTGGESEPATLSLNDNHPPDTAKEEVYDRPNSIVIEKIGVDAPLVYAQSTSQKELDRVLNDGVAIYPGSVMPGQNGDFFLTGHSSVYPWNKTIYGQVFAALDKLEIGDRITVYFDRRKYEYKITDKYTAAPQDVHLINPPDEQKITLMTCWPIGTNLKRLIIEGGLDLDFPQ